MLIGAHVSPAGGPANAVARGVERGCRSIQIFNQSPRAWRPREYSDEEVAAFHDAIGASDVDALLIHAVYLLNCASEDEEIRGKSLTALISALNAGAALKAVGVVLHPGSALKAGGDVGEAIERAGAVIAEALDGVRRLPAAPGGHRGRRRHARALLRGARGAARGRGRRPAARRSAWTPATCWPPATTCAHAESLAAVLDEFDAVVGLDRLGSLHVNDSMTPLGSNRDRHANLGDGEIGADGIAAFLSEPRFEGLPVIFEGPGATGKGVERADIENAVALRERGLAARG